MDASQNGLEVKSGEKVSGVELTIAEGAASLKGKVVPANENVKFSKRIRVHLIPAEMAAANEALRYYETIANNDGSFDLKNLAPGRYLAEAVKNEIELKSCQRVKDHVLRWQP
jgi:hypothetical protein